jgi:hypothetical protein
MCWTGSSRRSVCAKAPVVGLAVAERQTFRQVLGADVAHGTEARRPRHEGLDLGFGPAACVALVTLFRRHVGVGAAARGLLGGAA